MLDVSLSLVWVNASYSSFRPNNIGSVSLCEEMKTILQISVGMATESNRKMHMAFKCFLWKLAILGERLAFATCVHFCSASLCLSLVPSSSVASSNQDIMRAKRGCISTPRSAWILWATEENTQGEKGNIYVSGLIRGRQHRDCAATPCPSVPPNTEVALVCFSDTQKRPSLSSHQPGSIPTPHPASCHLAPCLPPYRNLAHPGSSCSGASSARAESTETPPGPAALQAATDRCVCVCMCVSVCLHVYVTVPLAQDKPIYKSHKQKLKQESCFLMHEHASKLVDLWPLSHH